MTIAIGDVLKIVATLVWLDGNLAQNVYAAEITGTGGPYDEADIVDDALEWVEDMYFELVGKMSDEIDGSMVQVYVYDPGDDDFDEIGTVGWTFNPSQPTDQLPRGVAGLINTQTVEPDVQGKKYLPGLCEVNCDDGLWDEAMITALAAFGVVWLAPFAGGTSGADWSPGVWSPTRSDFFDADGEFLISTIPAYQRRRKRGVGV
jgi:hypothetical protein